MKSLKDNSFLLINLSHLVTVTLSLIGAIINVLLLHCTWVGERDPELWRSPPTWDLREASQDPYYIIRFLLDLIFLLSPPPNHHFTHSMTATVAFLLYYNKSPATDTLVSDTCTVTSDWTNLSPDIGIIKFSHLQVFVEMLTFQRGLPWPFLYDTDTWPLPLLLTPSSLTGIIFSFIPRTLRLHTLVNVSMFCFVFYFCLAH